MGLAEPKRKKKLIPANSGRTNWENVSAAPSVAFKLMSSMGWTPGKGLGEKLDGEKESLRYLVKDDLLGIGAKKEYGGGVWRGMGEVDDLYARLDVGGSTPKEEEIMNEEVEEVGRPLFGWKMKFMNGTVLQNSVETVEESIVKSEVVIVEDEAEDVKEVVVLPASKKRKTEDKKEKKSSKKRKTGENGETGTPKKKPKKKKRKSKKALKKAKKDKTPVKEEGKSPKVKKEKTEKPKPSKSESNGAASGSSTPRNYHRAKFLAMKKASVSDKKGLKEILGVKIKREPKD